MEISWVGKNIYCVYVGCVICIIKELNNLKLVICLINNKDWYLFLKLSFII